jgi:aryl carrier-like protein
MSLPVSKILQAQTIAKMVDIIDSRSAESQTTSQSDLLNEQEDQLQALLETFEPELRNSVERVLPVAPGQEALIADMLRSEFHQYYNSDVLQLRDDVDLEKLKSAWQTVVDAHPILRTSFIEVASPDIDAVFAQLVHRPAPLNIKEIEVSELSELREYIKATRSEVSSSYSRQSPLRLCIATISSERYLVLSLAHAQYDGHSLGLLHQDVPRAYQNEFEARPSYDTAINHALDATGRAATDFWRSTLSGAKTARFCDGSDIHTPGAVSHRVELTSAVPVGKARSLCQKAGITLPALAQASWGALLANHVQELDVIFGVVLACRDSEEAENVMFPTMNTVPMRVSLHGSGEEMLRDVQNAINQVRPFQRTPLRAIQAACSGVVSHQTSDTALIDTLFIYQQGPEQTVGEEVALYKSVDAISDVEFPVAVEVEVVNEHFIIRAACKNYALDQQGAEALLERYDRVLEFLVSHADKATVEFSDSQVSICGLAPFKQYSNISSSQSMIFDSTDSEGEHEEESPVVQTICEALAQVSKMSADDVSSNATIESIGIDSISAIKVTAILRKMDVHISVSDLLKAQTARRMAGMVKTTSGQPTTNGNGSGSTMAQALQHLDLATIQKTANISNRDVEAVLPATAGQTYMLAMWLKSNGQMFQPTFKYHIKTTASADEITSAWQSVVRKHGILRTVFCATGDSETPLLQFVLRPDANRASTAINEQPADQQPLVNMQLSEAPAGYDIELKIQHALYDAVSVPLLMEDFQDHIIKRQPRNAAVTFEDFLSLSASPAARQSSKEFWTEYTRNARPLHLARPKATSHRKVQIFKSNILNPEVDLERRARDSRVTMQALLFASYAKVYARHAAHKPAKGDVVLGIYVANRAHIADLDQLAAPTLNLVPLIVRSPLHTSLLSSAKQIDRDLRRIGTAENAAVSLQNIFEWSHGAVKIDSFVNFLRVPAGESNGTDSDEVLTETSDMWKQDVSRVQEPTEATALSIPEELQLFKPGEAYDVSFVCNFVLFVPG